LNTWREFTLPLSSMPKGKSEGVYWNKSIVVFRFSFLLGDPELVYKCSSLQSTQSSCET
jgi:hypothetical protein